MVKDRQDPKEDTARITVDRIWFRRWQEAEKMRTTCASAGANGGSASYADAGKAIEEVQLDLARRQGSMVFELLAKLPPEEEE